MEPRHGQKRRADWHFQLNACFIGHRWCHSFGVRVQGDNHQLCLERRNHCETKKRVRRVQVYIQQLMLQHNNAAGEYPT